MRQRLSAWIATRECSNRGKWCPAPCQGSASVEPPVLRRQECEKATSERAMASTIRAKPQATAVWITGGFRVS